MNQSFRFAPRSVRGWVAAAGVTGLMGTAAWSGLAASPHAESAQGHPSAIAHAVAAGRDSYADVVDVVSPAVVTVHATGRARASETQFSGPDEDLFRQFFGERGGPQQRQSPRHRQSAMGSGVVVTGDGYILTNNHVVDGADTVSVDFTDGRTLDAKVVGTDQPSDLALLKVAGSGFRSLTLGDSDSVKVGDVVLAVGNPLNVGQTVTMGIISAKGRSTGVGDGSYEDFLQTDAPINHGNSGGALVNMKGELIGINSQIVSNSDGNIGIGFAIPANMARRVMGDLRTGGAVKRSQLGVTVQTVTADMAKSLGLKENAGVIVSSVAPDSAAAHAGITRGDVITSFNGQPVHDMNTLRNRVADTAPGTSVEVAIIRDGAEKHLTAHLEALESRTARGDEDGGKSGGSHHAVLGITVAPLTPEIASKLGVGKDTQGVVIEEVDPDGAAADAGIRAGDVIEEVNRKPVKSVADVADARSGDDKPTLLLIRRQTAEIFVTVRPSAS